ncbi:NlpC/P60 family protein [Streptomyces antnestii]|uniref:NlpC/P60 family protein n=1 Tax=Streptomyces antnestii TaxID=2494256 RepID=A0A437P6N7_9ACTN|nr:NlpC/P60 family protein [Streptomyces sp. San01]RVU17872.1 NlpC/P60 family protein [Streptomyces sp. San01]
MAAAHRKPRQRSLTGPTARTAATLALASAATATAFDGAAHAEPRLTPSQVKAKVDRLYQEAEKATEKYNGAKEKADKAEKKLDSLRDEAARRTDRLNARREALGSAAAAQYRTGALDPAVQLFLSSDPARYLDNAALADRLGTRQASAVEHVRRELREIGQLRDEADGRLTELRKRQAELKTQKKTVTGKLAEAKRLLDRLPAAERTGIGAGAGSGATGTDGRASRSDGSREMPSGALPEAPDSRSAAAIAYAYKALGSPYVWGATGPNAFDCSGLTQAAYRSAGISLPRTTYSQINAGPRIPRSQLQPGDLVFFYSGISHVGLYIGGGKMIHAPNPSAPVRIAPIDQMPFAGATRVA